VMLCLTVSIEVIYIIQAIRYRRDELAPGLSAAKYSAGLLLSLADVYVVWLVAKAALNDDLYLIAFGLTVVVWPIFGTVMILRRQSAVAQSILMSASFLGLPIGYFLATTIYFGDAFPSPEWIALGVTSVVWGLVLVYLVWHFQHAQKPGGPRRHRVSTTTPQPAHV
jgi:hypothetical protein